MEKMHPSFPDWYRAARIAPDGEVLTKRWAAIHAFAPNGNAILDLIRLFFQIGKPSDTSITSFREAFQKKDPAFPSKGNDVELRVLAGAELFDCWDIFNQNWSSYVSLAAVCTSCRGLRTPHVPEILELAIDNLAERSVGRFTAAKPSKAADFGTEMQAKLKTSCEQSAVPNLLAPFTSLIQEVVRLRTILADQQQQLSLQAEETNIVWWLIGEQEDSDGKHFSELEIAPACLYFGRALASLVTVTPGPLAARAFLDRALRITGGKPEGPVRIKDAVAALPRELREVWLSETQWDDALLDFCPLHQALRLSLSTSKKDAWLPAFEQASGLKRDAALPARELAYQLYLERVLYAARKSAIKNA